MDFDPAQLAAYLNQPQDPTSIEQARARAAALRGQSGLGQVAMLGDDWSQNVGKSLISDAQHAQSLDNQGQRYQALDRFHQVGEALRAKSLAAQDAKRGDLVPEKLIDGSMVGVNRVTGETKQLSGPLRRAASAGGGKGGLPAPLPDGTEFDPTSKEGKEILKQANLFNDSISLSKGRGSLLPKLETRLQASERVKASALDENGNIKDLSPALINELATGTAALVAQGSPGEHAIQGFLPKGRSMNTANLVEWLTNEPHGAGQQAYVKMMVDLANREERTIKGQVLRNQLTHFGQFAPYLKKYPKYFGGIAASNLGKDYSTHLDPETLTPLEERAAEHTQTSGTGPTHYLISPDQKMRRPADASGKPVGPPEPNPAYVPPDKVATRG